jgi:hypothetical protein
MELNYGTGTCFKLLGADGKTTTRGSCPPEHCVHAGKGSVSVSVRPNLGGAGPRCVDGAYCVRHASSCGVCTEGSLDPFPFSAFELTAFNVARPEANKGAGGGCFEH